MTETHMNNLLLKRMNDNPEIMTKLYINVLATVEKYPPAKNENKFIYGKVCEDHIIHWFDEMCDKCIDLDKQNKIGSEYKNDCEVSLDGKHKKYSIKMSKSGGDITLINKRNKSEHTVQGCNFIICHFKNERIYLFEHNEELDPFIKESHESIKYKSSIFTYLNKNKKYFYEFPNNETIKNFKNNVLPHIKEEHIYDTLAQKIREENKKYY